MLGYKVSQDMKSGMWYAHKKDFRMFRFLEAFQIKNQNQMNIQKCITIFQIK